MLFRSHPINRPTVAVPPQPPEPPPELPPPQPPDPPDSGDPITLREIATTGSIDASSNQLVIPDDVGFLAGDFVIVEIGQEPGAGLRGTRGVGGTWPATSYANTGAMNADTSRTNGYWAWVETTGDVYRFLNGAWMQVTYYYGAKVVPRSLQARCLAVSVDGLTLTLDKTAAVSVTGANVYLDVAPTINLLTDAWHPSEATGMVVQLPSGTFAIGGLIQVRDKSGWTLRGQGEAETELFSPKGTPCAMFEVRWPAYNTILEDFTLRGNMGDNGFGFNWPTAVRHIGGLDGNGLPAVEYYAQLNSPVTDADMTFAGTPRSILFIAATGSIARNITVIDAITGAVATNGSDDTWARDVTVVQTTPFWEYVQWALNWDESIGGGCEDCSITAPYLVHGYEAFKCSGTVFRRMTCTNAIASLNQAGNWLIEDSTQHFTPNCVQGAWELRSQPIVNVNSNTGGDLYTGLGGTVDNLVMTQDGYAMDSVDSLPGITSQALNPNVHVIGGSFTSPNYHASATRYGAIGVSLLGETSSAENFTVVGTAKPGVANIRVDHGPAINCTADVITDNP